MFQPPSKPRRAGRSRAIRRRSRSFPPVLDALEKRQLLSWFSVNDHVQTSVGDSALVFSGHSETDRADETFTNPQDVDQSVHADDDALPLAEISSEASTKIAWDGEPEDTAGTIDFAASTVLSDPGNVSSSGVTYNQTDMTIAFSQKGLVTLHYTTDGTATIHHLNILGSTTSYGTSGPDYEITIPVERGSGLVLNMVLETRVSGTASKMVAASSELSFEFQEEDVVATKLDWADGGGVDYAFDAFGDLPDGITVGLFWASSTTKKSIIGGPIGDPIAVDGEGSYGPYHVSREDLGDAPPGARYLLLVPDVDNLLAKTNPDASIKSLTLPLIFPEVETLVAQDGLDFTYTVLGASLNVDTTVAVYWGKLPSSDQQNLTFGDTIGPPIATFPAEKGVGTYGPIHLSPGQYGPMPEGANILMVVADPDRLLPTTRDDIDFALLRPADLSVDDVSFNDDDQTVEVDYGIGGYDLTRPSTIALYWATGTTRGTAIGGPAYIVTTETHTGDHTATIDRDQLGEAPEGAAFLIAVGDPDNNLAEPDEGNNVASAPIPSDPTDLAALPPSWDVKDGGADFYYAVSGANVPTATTVALYWAGGETFDSVIGAPIHFVVVAAGTTANTYGRFHVTPGEFGTPPEDASYVLLVADPPTDGHPTGDVTEISEDNNTASLPFQPEIEFVSSKYDGDPDPDRIGRFFADPTDQPAPLTDESLTLRLSDSLAALRPTLRVGALGAKPDADSAGWDGRTYRTDDFDPGTIFDDAFLPSSATVGDRVLAEQNSPRFRVVPLPAWYNASTPHSVTFKTAPAPGGGAYSFKVYIGSLGSSHLYSIPDDVPMIGGRPLGATLGYGVTTTAPLAVNTSTLTPLDGFAGLSLNFADLATVDLNLDTTRDLGDGWKIQVIPRAPLDPTTLEMDGGFGMTLKVTGSSVSPDKVFVDRQFFVGLFLADVGIKGNIALTLTAQATVSLDQGTFQLVSGGLTYLQLGPTATLTGFADIGWFIPLKFIDPILKILRARFPKYFPPTGNLLPELKLKNELIGSIELHARVDYSGNAFGAIPYFDVSAGGTVDLQVKETLVFTIGNTNLLGKLPPFVIPLFPKTFPYHFVLLS